MLYKAMSKLIFIIYWYVPWIKKKRTGQLKTGTDDVLICKHMYFDKLFDGWFRRHLIWLLQIQLLLWDAPNPSLLIIQGQWHLSGFPSPVCSHLGLGNSWVGLCGKEGAKSNDRPKTENPSVSKKKLSLEKVSFRVSKEHRSRKLRSLCPPSLPFLPEIPSLWKCSRVRNPDLFEPVTERVMLHFSLCRYSLREWHLEFHW